MIEYILIAHFFTADFKMVIEDLGRFGRAQECNAALIHHFNDPQYAGIECTKFVDGQYVPRTGGTGQVLYGYTYQPLMPPTRIIIE